MRRNRMFLMSCAILTAAGMVIAGIGAAMGGWIYGVFVDAKGIHVNAPLLRQNDTQKISWCLSELSPAPISSLHVLS